MSLPSTLLPCVQDAASKAAEHPAPAAPTPRSHHALPANQPEQALMVPMDEGVANLKVNKVRAAVENNQGEQVKCIVILFIILTCRHPVPSTAGTPAVP